SRRWTSWRRWCWARSSRRRSRRRRVPPRRRSPMPRSSRAEAQLSQQREQFRAQIRELRERAASASTDDEARMLISRIAQISRRYRILHGVGMAESPLAQAVELDKGYRQPRHLAYLSDQVADAVRDVERGMNRMLAVSMPPRAGKSQLISRNSPIWM